jgi:hypothetical protein
MEQEHCILIFTGLILSMVKSTKQFVFNHVQSKDNSHYVTLTALKAHATMLSMIISFVILFSS